jgi:hypothetical protein
MKSRKIDGLCHLIFFRPHEKIFNNLFLFEFYKYDKFGIKIVYGTNIISICKLRKMASRMCVHLFWRTSQTQIEEIPHENNGILGSLF